MQQIKARLYLDSDDVLQAEMVENTPENTVFTVMLPLEGLAMIEACFVDMEISQAQQIALHETDRIAKAIGNEGTRVGVQDLDEKYYMLQFKLHPSQNKYRNKIAKRLGDAIAKHDGWLNPVVVTVGVNEYRFDMVVKNEDATRQAIARILKQYVVKEFQFEVNDLEDLI